MNDRKYPLGLFIFGYITNVFFHFSWLFIPAVILSVIGIWVKTCFYIGMGLLFIDLVLSFIEQLRIRDATLEESDHPDIQRFQNALSKDGNWVDNVKEFIQDTIDNYEE